MKTIFSKAKILFTFFLLVGWQSASAEIVNRIEVPVGIVLWNEDFHKEIVIQSQERPMLRTGYGYGPIVFTGIKQLSAGQWDLDVTIDPHCFIGQQSAVVPIEVQVGRFLNRYEIIMDFPQFNGNWCRQISLNELNPIQPWSIRREGVEWVSARMEKGGDDLSLAWTAKEGGVAVGQVSLQCGTSAGPVDPVVETDRIVLRDRDGNVDFIRVWLTRFKARVANPAKR